MQSSHQFLLTIGGIILLGLVASNHFPEYRQMLLSVVISSTVFFELTGPVLTRLALRQSYKSNANKFTASG